MNETEYFSSIGYLAQQLQLPVPTLVDWLDTLGAKPAIVLNGVPHYSGSVYGALLLKKRGETR